MCLEFCAAAFECTVASLQRPIPELVAYYKELGFHREVKKRLEGYLRDELSAAAEGISLRKANTREVKDYAASY